MTSHNYGSAWSLRPEELLIESAHHYLAAHAVLDEAMALDTDHTTRTPRPVAPLPVRAAVARMRHLMVLMRGLQPRAPLAVDAAGPSPHKLYTPI